MYYQIKPLPQRPGANPNTVPDEERQIFYKNESFTNGGEEMLVSNSQGSMECGIYNFKGKGSDSISNIAYWNKVPYDYHMPKELIDMKEIGPTPKYLAFERDNAGWNNARLGYECMILLALLTGRTLVMPPQREMSQQSRGDTNKENFLEGFMPFEQLSKVTGLEVISMDEFFKRESAVTAKGLEKLNMPSTLKLSLKNIYRLLTEMALISNNTLVTLNPKKNGLVFPFEPGSSINMEDIRYKDHPTLKLWLNGRKMIQYDQNLQQTPILYWPAHKETRLLMPFYTFTMHSNESINRYLKRIFRDYVRYENEIFCKASQILSLLKNDAVNGTFSSFHVRRGDFYLEKKKTTPEEMMVAAEPYLKKGETVYIATDERNKTFFSPLQKIYDLKFLDDFWERASVDDLSNKSFVAMVDGVVASHGRTYTGTWFSTYSAYILRMRGYLGHPRSSNWYFLRRKRNNPQIEQWPVNPFWMTEWYQGWEGIDQK